MRAAQLREGPHLDLREDDSVGAGWLESGGRNHVGNVDHDPGLAVAAVDRRRDLSAAGKEQPGALPVGEQRGSVQDCRRVARAGRGHGSRAARTAGQKTDAGQKDREAGPKASWIEMHASSPGRRGPASRPQRGERVHVRHGFLCRPMDLVTSRNGFGFVGSFTFCRKTTSLAVISMTSPSNSA